MSDKVDTRKNAMLILGAKLIRARHVAEAELAVLKVIPNESEV